MKKEEYGCNGCDYITNVSKDKEIRCEFEDKNSNKCYEENYIYVDGKKVFQPSESKK